MAAAAGTALLRSVATKMGMSVAPRAPSLRRPLFGCWLRDRRPFSSSAASGPTPSPTNNKDLSQYKVFRSELESTKAAYTPIAPKVAYFVLFSTMAYLYCYLLPKFEELSDKMGILCHEVDTLSRENSILTREMLECKRTHMEAKNVLADSSQARSMESLVQGDGQQAS